MASVLAARTYFPMSIFCSRRATATASIGANGAGKSTFLKILSGELEPTKGEVIIDPKLRMSVLKQDHHAYDAYTVFETILMGNPRLYEVLKQKDALYAKEDFSDADGDLAAELEAGICRAKRLGGRNRGRKALAGPWIGQHVAVFPDGLPCPATKR